MNASAQTLSKVIFFSALAVAVAFGVRSEMSRTANRDVALSPLERVAEQHLTELLGEGAFKVYLSCDSELVVSKSEDLKLGRSVVQSEQIKTEQLARGSHDKAGDSGYSYETTSRNYLVEQTRTTSYTTRTEVRSIKCVVVVEKGAWCRVDATRKVLPSLLGIVAERGDELSFVEAP